MWKKINIDVDTEHILILNKCAIKKNVLSILLVMYIILMMTYSLYVSNYLNLIDHFFVVEKVKHISFMLEENHEHIPKKSNEIWNRGKGLIGKYFDITVVHNDK